MPFLNYHHLMYFWTVAREGGVARAAEKLHLSSPTISAQIHELEDMLGDKLFERRGRSLVLTEIGQMAYKYADDIFMLGRELLDAVKVGPEARPRKLAVGIADAMPKLVSVALLEPALALEPACAVVATEDKIDALLVELATYRIDLILSDTPIGAGSQLRAYNHLLGESGVTFFGGKNLVAKYSKDFPRCLDGAPLFLPTRNTSLRRSLDQYFDANGIHPRILGEFEDAALLQAFGQTGRALFPASALVEEEVCRQNAVKVIGRLDGVRERFYAISPERKLKHPAVVAICAAARGDFFR
ncbi:MAG TPA: transcriptional activator NhaR [Phycisphaerae bacterium]|jgi:LysR family transcriptional activator of nhaA|nr:transcriptional activator NhaR [Phycisphaerae bacterium]